jgi:diguanylate cyclase (GGDEF)-like protein
MTGAVFIQLALVSTSAAIALILGIAWHEFGRPRHVLTWAVSFAVAAVQWGMSMIPLFVPGTGRFLVAPLFACAAFAAAGNTIGFRQRAGIRNAGRPLLIAASGFALLGLAFAIAGTPRMVRIVPLNVFNMTMFYLSARTLQGRRKGERVAERVAEIGLLLLALFNLIVLTGMVAAWAGLAGLEMAEFEQLTLLLLPGITGGIGLFMIILLAADLADQARRLAATDMLTGLLNRRGFEEAANALITSARRHRRALTLMLMDLDRFKQVNDLFGHPAGDRVLWEIGDKVANGLGRRDIVARFGGEEFAMVVADADIVGATMTAETLRRSIAALDLQLPQPHQVTASFGLAALHEEDSDLASLLKRADEALYRSKAEGRNRVTLG